MPTAHTAPALPQDVSDLGSEVRFDTAAAKLKSAAKELLRASAESAPGRNPVFRVEVDVYGLVTLTALCGPARADYAAVDVQAESETPGVGYLWGWDLAEAARSWPRERGLPASAVMSPDGWAEVGASGFRRVLAPVGLEDHRPMRLPPPPAVSDRPATATVGCDHLLGALGRVLPMASTTPERPALNAVEVRFDTGMDTIEMAATDSYRSMAAEIPAHTRPGDAAASPGGTDVTAAIPRQAAALLAALGRSRDTTDSAMLATDKAGRLWVTAGPGGMVRVCCQPPGGDSYPDWRRVLEDTYLHRTGRMRLDADEMAAACKRLAGRSKPEQSVMSVEQAPGGAGIRLANAKGGPAGTQEIAVAGEMPSGAFAKLLWKPQLAGPVFKSCGPGLVTVHFDPYRPWNPATVTGDQVPGLLGSVLGVRDRDIRR